MNSVHSDLLVQINDLLGRFFLSFDQKDWSAMADCLAPQVAIDYASSGREPPSTMSGDDFVSRRRDASVADGLSKQHSFSNLLITPQDDENTVSVRCNYLILRFALPGVLSEAEDDFFHSCGSYQFLLCDIEGKWKISSITQHALRSWGNADLHQSSRLGANA